MAWELDTDRPIYAQLVERIQMQIVSGQYPPGSKLPSVRELAAVAAVNPNTMQKAFAELERSGLIITQRTNGRSVTEDEERIHSIREGLAQEYVEQFLGKMQELGYTGAQAERLLRRKLSGEVFFGAEEIPEAEKEILFGAEATSEAENQKEPEPKEILFGAEQPSDGTEKEDQDEEGTE